MVLVVFNPGGLLEVGVGFELVDGGFDWGGGEEVGQLGRGEIGDANLADFEGEEEGGHCVPCLGMVGLAGVPLHVKSQLYIRQRSGLCSFLRMMRLASA